MSHLYPPSLDHLDSRFDAEKEVFDLMKALDDSYHVFHSATWKDNRDGECDLIIFHELKGFIALEVKGGGIKHDGQQWTSSGNKGVFIIHNPIKQARDAMYAIKRTWEEKYKTPLPGTFSWAVCFPDCVWDNSSRTLDLDEKDVLDAKKMGSATAWIDARFAEMHNRHGAKILSTNESKQFIQLFSKTMSLTLSLNRAIVRQEEELRITDRMQDYLLDIFDDKHRIGFQGAAGTGKTWIAMKKARRLSAEGKSILFLSYNRQVNDFVAGKLNDTKPVTVKTFHAFAQGIIREYLKGHLVDQACVNCFFSCLDDISRQLKQIKAGGDNDPGEPRGKELTIDNKLNNALHFLSTIPAGTQCSSILEEHGPGMPAAVRMVMKHLLPEIKVSGGYYEERMPMALMSIFIEEPSFCERNHFDALIIDEAQDFHKDWCDCLQSLFLKYEDRTCYIFYDDNQTIFTNDKELPVVGLIGSAGLEDHIFRLKDNLRNTAAIHDYAVSTTGKGGTSRPFEIPGITPIEKTVKSDSAARSAVGNILDELIVTHGISRDRIVVLSNRSMDNSVFSGTPAAGEYTMTESAGLRGKGVRFRTIQKFKGLESDVVILIVHRRAQDSDARYLADELLYVGCTRAKHVLYVVNVEG